MTVVFEYGKALPKRYLIQWSRNGEAWFDEARYNWLWVARLHVLVIRGPNTLYRILDTWEEDRDN